ncbi:MAG: 3-hydroxyacyl-CoA dehydrogenase family protein [Myxococcota bacterium]
MKIGVLGAGTMGHGIAQVCAMAGHEAVLSDVDEAVLERAMGHVRANLDKGVDRGKVDAAVRDRALAGLSTGPLAAAATDADLVIEAVPERLPLKIDVFRAVQAHAPAECIFGTNTSSLSIGAIAEGLDDPGRVVGTHFFNPVHVMKLLEVVVADVTRDEVRERVVALGREIGKEVIVVKDRPGFATSRLGVCLGMEAIRMAQEEVASPEDIDKAMVLGYRHPMGPLRLTDLVGLDVRLHIGRYLAKELGNPAFEPPALMEQMVEEGRLGQKSGRGFYDWPPK